MNDDNILEILKIDLQLSVDSIDGYLKNLIILSKEAINEEGITLSETSISDGMLVEMYTAYLYRKRKGTESVMPRMLRYNLNNRLLKQKAKE